MKSFVAAFTLMLVSTAQADTFCDDINNLVAYSIGPPKTIVTLTLPQPDGAETACAYARGVEGTRFVHCAWPFNFREPAAKEAFETISETLLNCPTARQRDFKDQGVNHPDSYELRIFDLDGAEVGLSLKDKGALQQTLVFLRVQRR